MKKLRIAINGFGRIGRSVLRAWAEDNRWPTLDIVAVNDIAGIEACAYLFKYDSVFGPFRGHVETAQDALIVNGHRLRFSAAPDLSQLDLTDIDLVLDCTGKARNRAFAARAIAGGAKRVLISGPCPDADLTLVLGANDTALSDQPIVSNASCTTNALAPLMRLLDDAYAITTGSMTTIHCYTRSQPTVDAPTGGELVRSRAAALSMVPTTTSAGHLTDLVLPHLAGRIQASAVRVPVASVSAVDLAVMTDTAVTADAVNALMQGAGGVIGYEDDPLVSSDLRQRPESIIMAGIETRVTDGGLLRVFGWYDNEWGFSCRMLDVAAKMAG
ncbi:type I glyceraldehyde-3-phosphate dehydrogenase [Pseudogemmobacter sp. W21_MBD1_M6]|uniref:type I glyceraldehyde-3-phosphate dehydrogenase n=1 Tax=Pseudogemmobacter sp. W21_MBD1_M6 TaxID=3240271 RepID=UPI003F9DB96D